jgi:hypothetical protein
LLYSLQQERKRKERETPVSKAWWNSVMTHPFLNYIPEDKPAFLWLSPWRILDSIKRPRGKWVVAKGARKKAWWKWLQPLMTHPLLNYIPGQDPELHPWAGGYIRWGPAQESSVPVSPEYLQEEPSVELCSASEPLLSSEYSDRKRSRSTVRNISYQEHLSRSDHHLAIKA